MSGCLNVLCYIWILFKTSIKYSFFGIALKTGHHIASGNKLIHVEMHAVNCIYMYSSSLSANPDRKKEMNFIKNWWPCVVVFILSAYSNTRIYGLHETGEVWECLRGIRCECWAAETYGSVIVTQKSWQYVSKEQAIILLFSRDNAH